VGKMPWAHPRKKNFDQLYKCLSPRDHHGALFTLLGRDANGVKHVRAPSPIIAQSKHRFAPDG
jgi:hypothetical protein